MEIDRFDEITSAAEARGEPKELRGIALYLHILALTVGEQNSELMTASISLILALRPDLFSKEDIIVTYLKAMKADQRDFFA